jgi:exopolyphosphatase/guanosine-5'-triphosphate,3'-diphosphate pyrophosphatase
LISSNAARLLINEVVENENGQQNLQTKPPEGSVEACMDVFKIGEIGLKEKKWSSVP